MICTVAIAVWSMLLFSLSLDSVHYWPCFSGVWLSSIVCAFYTLCLHRWWAVLTFVYYHMLLVFLITECNECLCAVGEGEYQPDCRHSCAYLARPLSPHHHVAATWTVGESCLLLSLQLACNGCAERTGTGDCSNECWMCSVQWLCTVWTGELSWDKWCVWKVFAVRYDK